MSSLSGTIYRCAGASDVGGGQLARPSALPSPCIGLLVAAELSLSVSRRSRVVRCCAFCLSFLSSPLRAAGGTQHTHPIIPSSNAITFPTSRFLVRLHRQTP